MTPSDSTPPHLHAIDSSRIPKHVAIIMDGNGRWAKERNLARIEGHRQGAETVRRISRIARRMGVKALTLYAFSDENWARPKMEVAQLMELLGKFLIQERHEMKNNQIRLNVIGSVDRLPGFVQEKLSDALSFTQEENEMVLNLALSYGSKSEIIRGFKKIMREIESGTLKPSDVNPEMFSNYLDTAGLPDPELMIRTSGEFRISNFMLWQLAYTEIHVTKVLWPDFSEDDFHKAILDFQGRERRFGLTSEQIEPSGISHVG